VFKFERLDTLLARIGHLSHKLWPFEFAKSFHVQFRASRYIMRWNRTSEWKVMTIWISRELSLFIFEHIDISWASIIHTSQKLWLLEFAESFLVQFWASWYIVVLNWTSESKFMGIWICLALPCLILSVSIFWGPESNIRVKSYDHLNISRTSVLEFRASRYIIGLTHTPESKHYGHLNLPRAFVFTFERLCWISPIVTFWSTFSLYKYVQGKSGLPKSTSDHQVFKIKTDESKYQTQGTSLRQG